MSTNCRIWNPENRIKEFIQKIMEVDSAASNQRFHGARASRSPIPHQSVIPAKISPAPMKADRAKNPGLTRKPRMTPIRTRLPAPMRTCLSMPMTLRREPSKGRPSSAQASVPPATTWTSPCPALTSCSHCPPGPEFGGGADVQKNHGIFLLSDAVCFAWRYRWNLIAHGGSLGSGTKWRSHRTQALRVQWGEGACRPRRSRWCRVRSG